MTRYTFSKIQTRARQTCLGWVCVALSWASVAASEPPPSAPESLADVPTPEQLAQDPASAGLALFDLLEGAERAERQKDYATAVKYYLTLARLVPERATAFSKLCEMYEALGQRAEGMAACYRATGLEGAKVGDNLRYLRLLLSTPDGSALAPNEAARARATLQHLAQSGMESPEIDLLGCQFAVHIENHDAMRGCVQRLEQTQPGSPVTLTYALSLALFERDFARARHWVAEARRISMGPDSIALMESQLEAVQSEPGSAGALTASGLVRWGLPAGGFAAVGAWGLVAWGKRRRPKAA